ncbi:hypothetical protein [Rhizobium leucaenae]|uniref:Uncharacterized protein n=1 Tax=Rhizobium leucaenae TaxID=29450 RepID=A0A7W6ZV27_9HYPH|nr:hypothetical protein [Rhizobium leucaenae]MBB4569304.1 hypothetical protein [Rhizobium leucaenae]MBB6302756.1 hypothetical protein [Rhizobium leucaenae]
MLQFKMTSLSSRRGEPNNGKPEGMLLKSHTPLAASIFTKKDLKAIRSAGGTLGLIIIPLLIVLCSIVAGFAVAMHISGQPGYSARVNMSSSIMSE